MRKIILNICLTGKVPSKEDNLFYDRKRTTLASNKMHAERIKRLIKELELEVVTPREARDALGISS